MPLRRTAFAALVSACALEGSAYGATTERTTPYGAFELVEEVRTADPGEVPIMHVATEWTKLHLRWRSSDGRMKADLADDGYIMEFNVDGHDCGGRTAYLTYAGRPGEERLRRAMRHAFDTLLRLCPRVTGAERGTYRAEFAEARGDYASAVGAMKKEAVRLFHAPLERCLPPKVPEPFACDRKG